MRYSIVVLTLVEHRRQHHVEVEQQRRLQAGVPSVGCALHGGCDASCRLALHVQQAHHHLVGAFLRGVAYHPHRGKPFGAVSCESYPFVLWV